MEQLSSGGLCSTASCWQAGSLAGGLALGIADSGSALSQCTLITQDGRLGRPTRFCVLRGVRRAK